MQKWKQFNIFRAYWLVSVNLHPIWSFFRRFDYKHRRLVRCSVLYLQVSLITLALIAFYSMDDFDREIAPYIITFALGIFTLPLPRMLMSIIGAELAVTPAGPNSKTPEPEIIIQEHCRPLKVLFVLFNFLCYIFAMFAASVYACGLDTEENGTYRVS